MFAFQRKRARSNRAYTLAEVMIASVISGLLLLGVLSLQYISARTIKEVYGQVDMRSARMNALNQIRFYLCDAAVGSCAISDNKHRIRFQNPNQPGVTSEFFFNTGEEALYYDADIANSAPQKVAKGPIEITFNLGAEGGDVLSGMYNIVTVYLETISEMRYTDLDERHGETAIYLRNL